MKVLVTGGTGYIGSHTCIQLIEQGHTPVVIDNLCNSKQMVFERIEQVTALARDRLLCKVIFATVRS